MKLIEKVFLGFGLLAAVTVTNAAQAATWHGGKGGSQKQTPYGTFYSMGAHQGTFEEGLRFQWNGWNETHTEYSFWSTSWYGGSSSQNRYNACDPYNGYFIIGFHGRAGAFVDSLSIVCARWYDHAGLSNPGWEPGTGGSEFWDTCPMGQIVRLVSLRTGSYIDAINFECGSPVFFS